MPNTEDYKEAALAVALSILYLRCRLAGHHSGAVHLRATCTAFNSLFEMPEDLGVYLRKCFKRFTFNSLFEMQACNVRYYAHFGASTAFNSLFEMPVVAGVADHRLTRLSILYLRCPSRI